MAEGTTGHRQRLRHRFVAGEAQALTEQALLELVLTYAIPQKDVQPLAQRMIAALGGLRGVLAADRATLCAIDGVGEHAAALLQLIGWIGAHCFGGSKTASAEPAYPDRPSRQSSAGGNLDEAVQRPGISPEGVAATSPVAPQAVAAAVTTQQQDGTDLIVEHTQPRDAGPVAAQDPGDGERALAGAAEGRRWRAGVLYTANNASKNGLLEETRLALLAYDRSGDRATARRELLDGGLPQRSRATRETIVRVITDRLVTWHPPAWVCADLVASAQSVDHRDLCLLLLLYAARQDALLYDVAQQVIWPRWSEGMTTVSRADVQRFLDGALPDHPEIDRWSLATREKLAGNLLTILRDYGLLQGQQGNATKRIVEPVVSPRAAGHLARLLHEESIPDAEVLGHPDWRLWLLDVDRVRLLLARAGVEESI